MQESKECLYLQIKNKCFHFKIQRMHFTKLKQLQSVTILFAFDKRLV